LIGPTFIFGARPGSCRWPSPALTARSTLDAIAGGLRELPSVHLNELPRLADYAKWGEAVGRGLGWEPECFLSIYTDNRKNAT
jgi:hypothetical protein